MLGSIAVSPKAASPVKSDSIASVGAPSSSGHAATSLNGGADLQKHLRDPASKNKVVVVCWYKKPVTLAMFNSCIEASNAVFLAADVTVTSNQFLAKHMKIYESSPTFVFYKNGKKFHTSEVRFLSAPGMAVEIANIEQQDEMAIFEDALNLTIDGRSLDAVFKGNVAATPTLAPSAATSAPAAM